MTQMTLFSQEAMTQMTHRKNASWRKVASDQASMTHDANDAKTKDFPVHAMTHDAMTHFPRARTRTRAYGTLRKLRHLRHASWRHRQLDAFTERSPE
jgi:hypothetical protein